MGAYKYLEGTSHPFVKLHCLDLLLDFVLFFNPYVSELVH